MPISLLERCDPNLGNSICIMGNICGWISSFIWFTVLVPQIVKNFKEKSIEGLSLLWAILNFSASFVNLFFVYQNNLPTFAKISAVYMPVLEFSLLVQFYIYSNYSTKLRTTIFFLFLSFVTAFGIVNIFLSQYYINYLEWIAIVLWSIETFPQLFLNFKNKSTKGISNVSQVICFLGKTSDIIQHYFLAIPIQYRYLGFFSSSTAYIGNIQVLYYNKIKHEEKQENDNEFHPVYIKETESTEKSKFNVLNTTLIVIVVLLLVFSGVGLIFRTEYTLLSVGLVVAFYVVIVILYYLSN